MIWLAICMRMRLYPELVCKVLLPQVERFDVSYDGKEQK